MSEAAPGEAAPLRTVEIRVYYDPDTGNIVHVHSLVVAAGDELDDERIAEELAAFETSLTQRHGQQLGHIIADEAALAESISPTVNLRVDTESRRLVRDPGN